MDTLFFALYNNHEAADRAVNTLGSHGVIAQNISVIMKENKRQATDEVSERFGQGATGAAGGAMTGAVIGGLAGIVLAAGIIPGIAGLAVAGPIAQALGLTGAAATAVTGAVGGAVAGGLIGFLTNLGISRTDAERFSESIDRGGVLLAVPANAIQGKSMHELLEETHPDALTEVSVADNHLVGAGSPGRHR